MKASAPASRTTPTAKTAGSRPTDDMNTAKEHSSRESYKQELGVKPAVQDREGNDHVAGGTDVAAWRWLASCGCGWLKAGSLREHRGLYLNEEACLYKDTNLLKGHKGMSVIG